MSILFTILYFILMLVIILGGLMFLKTKVFNKIRINKFIPLSIAIVLTASIFVMNYAFKINYFILNSVIMILVVFSFSWFLEIVETGGPKVEKKIVIKPKAKPNRVKNMNKNKNK